MSGGVDKSGKAMSNCFTFNMTEKTLEPKKDMNYPRNGHCVQKVAQKIFAFGGRDCAMDFMKSAEVYDVVENSWKNLPDMLVEA